VPACRTKKRQWVIALTAIAVGWPWWALTKLLRTMNAVQRDEIARIADSVWVRTGAGGVRGTGRSCVRTIDEAVRRGVALTATCCSPCLSCPSRTSPSSRRSIWRRPLRPMKWVLSMETIPSNGCETIARSAAPKA
jgi:hypothetical protein